MLAAGRVATFQNSAMFCSVEYTGSAAASYVEDQSIKAAREDSARARAVGFTMAMLQRRFASSIYAVRRTLERMKEKREKILEDTVKYRQDQINMRLPEDFEDLTDE